MARNMRHAFGKKRDDLRAEHDRLLEKSRAAGLVRRERLPKPEFADDLPINARRGEIAALIESRLRTLMRETTRSTAAAMYD